MVSQRVRPAVLLLSLAVAGPLTVTPAEAGVGHWGPPRAYSPGHWPHSHRYDNSGLWWIAGTSLLLIASFDTVIVAIGSDFEANLMATVALKAVGVKRIICKALTERQQTILLRVGADKIVLPESEAGQRLALELGNPNLLDRIPLGRKHAVVELWVPDAAAGTTLQQAELRSRCGVTVVAVKRGESGTVAPPADFVLAKGDLLVVIGTNESVFAMNDWD